MELPNAFFVIGPNGVGKSTILPFLRSNLGENFEIHDFDERGVPNNTDKVWRQSETLYWLNLSRDNLEKDISTIVCGFIKPAEIVELSGQLDIQIKTCFLDVDKENLERRLFGRYTTEEAIRELERTTGKTVEKFIQDNVNVTSILRGDAEKNGFYILDTNNLSPEQTAQGVLNWVKEE